ASPPAAGPDDPAWPGAARGRRHRPHRRSLAHPDQRGGTGGDRPHPHIPELLAGGRDIRAMAVAKARHCPVLAHPARSPGKAPARWLLRDLAPGLRKPESLLSYFLVR